MRAGERARRRPHLREPVPLRSRPPDLRERLRGIGAPVADDAGSDARHDGVFLRLAAGRGWRSDSGSSAPGIHHILIGPDHLLFLVGLLLLGGSMRRLLLVVSAFTLAHSVTLSLAVLNLVTPPSRVVEPLIALSIVYVGRRQPAGPRRPRRAPVDCVCLRPDARVRVRERPARDGSAGAGDRLVVVVVQCRCRNRPAGGRRVRRVRAGGCGALQPGGGPSRRVRGFAGGHRRRAHSGSCSVSCLLEGVYESSDGARRAGRGRSGIGGGRVSSAAAGPEGRRGREAEGQPLPPKGGGGNTAVLVGARGRRRGRHEGSGLGQPILDGSRASPTSR